MQALAPIGSKCGWVALWAALFGVLSGTFSDWYWLAFVLIPFLGWISLVPGAFFGLLLACLIGSGGDGS